MDKMATAAAAVAQRFKLVVFVPTTHLEPVKTALFAAGAGHYPPKYSECCFVTLGTGSFRPAPDANPFLGKAGAGAEEIAEARLETVCHGADVVSKAVEALKKAHPYEEVAYDVLKLENF